MNILYVVPYPPSHIRVRPYELIRALTELGHTVTLASLWSSAEDKADLDRLEGMGIRVVAGELLSSQRVRNSLSALFSSTPIQAKFCWQPHFAKALIHLVHESSFDIVHVEHLRGARYGLHIRDHLAAHRASNNESHVPVVWDSVDCISLLFRQAVKYSRTLKGRLMGRLELERTARYEGWLVHQFDRVLLSSPVDADAMAELGKCPDQAEIASYPGWNTETKLAVVPNGVDLNYFRPGHEPRFSDRLVFTGKMSYHANATAALYLLRDIMPRVWDKRPKAQVWIVGKEPPREVRSLATCAENDARRLQTIDRPVVVTGTVPDIRPYLETATIAVAPVVYGAGIQNKVLEAMACGAPVIASTQAAAALKTQHGSDLIVAHDSDTFAKSILQLLDSSSRQNQLGLAGRAYVERYHSWPNVARQLEETYSTTIAQCDSRS